MTKPSPIAPIMERWAYIDAQHPLAMKIERTPPNPPPYDDRAYQRQVYAHRKRITALRSGAFQHACSLCAREVPVAKQVVDFDPRSGYPRGLVCRQCRHVLAYQVWRDGEMIYALDAAGARQMSHRLALICELTHASDSEDGCECHKHVLRWTGMYLYLEGWEEREQRRVSFAPSTPVKSKGAGTEVPTPLFLAPNS